MFSAKKISKIGLCSDIPMAQYIINMNASLPASDKFIIHILDSTHMFVQPQVEQMIRSQIAKFREDNTYVKPN
nr:general transcription and DNA repair factor IIH subunit TFB5 isoform X1 [Arachis hypogaea]XP_029148445.1 general transcription and DNA repair factor IIH subunit TFB5 isoform X1 [Arachis hypogaea]